MMERWIWMQDGVVVTGPGPLPIRLPDANGDPVRATELTEDQINALGWYRVAQSRRAFDRRFEVETGPAFTLIDGEPTDVSTRARSPGRWRRARSTTMASPSATGCNWPPKA